MRYIIPINPIPNQNFEIDLDGQRCEFNFLTRGAFMYMYMKLNNESIIDGAICLNKVNLTNFNEAGFKGKIYFEDTQGDLDPLYWGLNDRWILYYEVE